MRFQASHQWIANKVWTQMEDDELRKTGLRLSGIGKCARRLWGEQHSKVQAEQIEGRMLDLFGLGHRVEAHVVEMLQRAGFELLYTGDEQQTVVLWVDGEMIQGHPDGRIRIDGEWCILEIKSANEANFFKCQEVGLQEWRPAYYDQVQAYMGCTGLDACLFVVYSKNSSNWHVEKLRFDLRRYEQLHEKAELVMAFEVVPERPEGFRRGTYDCRFCHASEWCYLPTADVAFAP